jgi:hypothetical protein
MNLALQKNYEFEDLIQPWLTTFKAFWSMLPHISLLIVINIKYYLKST